MDNTEAEGFLKVRKDHFEEVNLERLGRSKGEWLILNLQLANKDGSGKLPLVAK